MSSAGLLAPAVSFRPAADQSRQRLVDSTRHGATTTECWQVAYAIPLPTGEDCAVRRRPDWPVLHGDRPQGRSGLGFSTRLNLYIDDLYIARNGLVVTEYTEAAAKPNTRCGRRTSPTTSCASTQSIEPKGRRVDRRTEARRPATAATRGLLHKQFVRSVNDSIDGG